MDFEKREDVTLSEYLKMIEYKTSVLLAASLQIGGINGGASAEQQVHLYEFGKNIGIAFQLKDDLLDAFGNPECIRISYAASDDKLIKAIDRIKTQLAKLS